MDIKYGSIEELKMQMFIARALECVPNDYRSQNHTQYLNEITLRIYDLSQQIGVDPGDLQFSGFVDEAMALMPRDLSPFIWKKSGKIG